jgi:hypothetical protein
LKPLLSHLGQSGGHSLLVLRSHSLFIVQDRLAEDGHEVSHQHQAQHNKETSKDFRVLCLWMDVAIAVEVRDQLDG